jgi:hypothetical protein
MDTQVHEFLKGEAKDVNFVDSPVKPDHIMKRLEEFGGRIAIE